MRRRSLFRLGLASTVLLAAAGLGVSLVVPAWQAGKLSSQGRDLFSALARAILQGALPTDDDAQAPAIQAHVGRVEDTIAGFPKLVQDELGLLLTVLTSAPGRLGLAGLGSSWANAPTADVQAMLQQLRVSSLDLRQQAYQALRDITYAAYYANRSTWGSLGYAGPPDL